jgi:hypothetical protein
MLIMRGRNPLQNLGCDVLVEQRLQRGRVEYGAPAPKQAEQSLFDIDVPRTDGSEESLAPSAGPLMLVALSGKPVLES